MGEGKEERREQRIEMISSCGSQSIELPQERESVEQVEESESVEHAEESDDGSKLKRVKVWLSKLK